MPGEEGRAFQQDRLAFFGKVGALFLLSSELAGRYGANEWRLDVGIRPFLAAAAALGAVWAASRWGRRSVETLGRIDASGLLLAGAALGSLGFVPLAFVDVTYPMVVNLGLLLIARAVILPSAASRTLVVSAAAAAPALAWMAWSAARSGLGDDLRSPGPANLAIQSGWLVAALLLSALASRVIYGLRPQVREARQLGQYTLEEKLGEGGMGVVYRARHALLRRPTAVKLLPPDAGRAAEPSSASSARCRSRRASPTPTRSPSSTTAGPPTGSSTTRWSTSRGSRSRSSWPRTGPSRPAASSTSCDRSRARSARPTPSGSSTAT